MLPAFSLFSRLGLVSGVDAVRCGLEEPPHQRVGGLEEGGAHQQFEFLHQLPVGSSLLKMSHQLLDFPVLGQEDFGRGDFFLAPAFRSARVLSTMS
jgi:hypothetical protein